ncbi:MAG TPA: HAMP domain-containing methyl-accepting chemotaxis protein [Acetobacteraceae bacterium]|nr:HAMP domain-containing methyl-accepting chemotaxis protein [Acetobacteraceae bacterium]
MRLSALADMRIAVRLGTSFFLVVALAAGLGAFAIHSVGHVASLTADLYDHPFAVTQGLLQARLAVQTTRRALLDAAVAESPAERGHHVTEAASQYTVAQEALARARSRFLGDPAGFDKAQQAVTAFQHAVDAALDLLRQGKVADALNVVRGQAEDAANGVNAALDPLIEFANSKAAAFMQAAAADQAWTVQLNLGLLALAMLLGAAVSTAATRSLTRPIGGLRNCMAVLAEGKHDVAVPGVARRDEIGAMAQAVEVFRHNAAEVERLRAEQEAQKRQAAEERRQELHRLAESFEAQVGGVVQAVTAAASQLQAASGQMTGNAGTTSERATAVASTSQEASANVQTVASATEELAASIREIGAQVERSHAVAGRADTEAAQTTALIQKLSDSVASIGAIVALINNIANQTNLLALNATIEAARAGDAGKGFAVVASEVKGLAGQTAKATSEIAAQIASVQGDTAEAVTAIGAITKVMAEMSAISATVAAAVQEQMAATAEIARNVEQAAAGTAEVSQHVATVEVAARETGQAAQHINESAGELLRQAERLRQEVGRFLANVRGEQQEVPRAA